MNYEKIYTNLITSRQQLDRVYLRDGSLEHHHIVPKSLGGDNSKSNLVLLTPREHFIAHWLLYKMHVGKAKAKMAYAFSKMCCNNPSQKRETNSHLYHYRRTIISKSCTGVNHHSYGINPFTPEQIEKIRQSKLGKNNPAYGKKPWNYGYTKYTHSSLKSSSDTMLEHHATNVHPQFQVPRTEQTKQKISTALTGKPKSDTHKANLSKVNMGKKLSDATKQKMSESRKGQVVEMFTCPHCNKTGAGSAMFRWHFDNCKFMVLV